MQAYLISYLEACEILPRQLSVWIQLYHKLKTTKIFVVRDWSIRASHSVVATFIVEIPTNGDMLSDWKAKDRCLRRQSENQTDCIFRKLISADE